MMVPKRDSLTPILPAWARWRVNELVLALRVQPGARRTAIAGEHGQRLKIALHAPPVDGKANEELLRFLCSELGLRRGQLRLLAGTTSREKSVAIESDASTAGRLVALLTGESG